MGILNCQQYPLLSLQIMQTHDCCTAFKCKININEKSQTAQSGHSIHHSLFKLSYTVEDHKYFHKINFPIRLQCIFMFTGNYFMALFNGFTIMFLLIESYMNCASNIFVSYRLFILYLNSMPLNLTFEFFCLFSAINVNGNLLFVCFFQILYKV